MPSTKATNSTGYRRDGLPATSVAPLVTGPTHGTDPSRRQASHVQPKAPSSSRSVTPATSSRQHPQATGHIQNPETIKKFYTAPSQESLDAPHSDPSSTRFTEGGDANRRSVGYPQLKHEESTHHPNPRSGVSKATKTGIGGAERGRRTEITNTTEAVISSRESSSAPSEGSSASETSDDEDPQSPVNYEQTNHPPNLPSRDSDPSAADGDKQLTQPVERNQHTEATNPVVAPPSRESSPPLSVDISATSSLNSGDSSRSSAHHAPSKESRVPAHRGSGVLITEAIQQPSKTPERDRPTNVSGKPDVYSSMEISDAHLMDFSTAEMVNSEDIGGTIASHISPIEPLSLTDLGSGGPAATEAVKHLVQAVGRDVVSFRRNTQVSYMVVERARDIVKSINEYITKVENSTTGDWDSFEKFTVAIEPLEEILFTLLAFTEDEKARYLASTGSIDDCVSSAESWASNRKELSRALDGFDTRQELVELFDEPNTDSRKLEHREAQIYDDRTLLGEMRTTIHTFISEDPERFPSYVQDVETSLDRLQARVIDESPPGWFTVITIQTSMLVEGVVEMVKVAALSTDILHHLSSRPVWKAASELIEVLEGVDEEQQTLPQSAQTKYDAFVETLKKMGKFSLPGTYVDLMKQAGRIRRPFQAQSFALVMLCRFLADTFNALGDSTVSVESFHSLGEAFDKTLVALQAATKAVSELRAFDLTDFERHDTVEAFGEAEVVIRECFKSFDLDSEWTKRQSELNAAFNKDKERMAKLNDILRKSPRSATAKVKVNVTIHDKSPDGAKLGATSVEEETTMRLLALRWSVAGVLKQEQIKRARTAGTFYKQTDGEWSEILASHSTLAEIVDSKSEVTLKLVIE